MTKKITTVRQRKSNIITKKNKPKSTNNYVDNAEFFKATVEYLDRLKLAKEQGLPKPQITNYIGECLMKIANRLSSMSYFRNYSYREDMVFDGIENCILYFDRFDPTRTQNPFAYFTQVIYFAFRRRIDKEKMQLVIKRKLMDKMILSDHDLAEHGLSMPTNESEYMDKLVEHFETKKAQKKQLQLQKK